MTQTTERTTNAAVRIPPSGTPRHEEALIDQALLETFPASDPISPAVEARLESAGDRADVEDETSTAAIWKARMRRLAPAVVMVCAMALVLKALTAQRRARD